MKIILKDTFKSKLEIITNFIAGDKPSAAKKFKKKILSRINEIETFPLSYRKSYYFDDPTGHVRDLIVDGYTIVFRIKPMEIEVFGLIKNEELLDF